MRSFQELKDAVENVTSTVDAVALMHCADELDALVTSEAEALAHFARGASCCFRGDYPAALEHWHRALAMHEELGNRRGVARVTTSIGNVHFSTGNYPAALEHFHRALAMHEELGNSSGVAGVTNNIGNVHMSTGDYPTALDCFHRALAINEELGNRSSAAINTGNIGNVHLKTGDYPEALEHYHRALAVHQELGESRSVASVTGNILAAMIPLGEYADTEALLHTMDRMQIEDPGVVVTRELCRASLQEHHGNIEEARATFRAALQIAQEHTLAPKQADVHKALRDLAQKQNDLASYIEHNNEYTRITEEINGKDTATKLAMQGKQREIDAVQREHQKHMAVLHSTLPKHVAERVARGEVVNDHFENASVIFLDIVGFTELSSSMSSQEVITLLDTIFSQCDAICEQHNVTKIKTIGDSYMCVSFESVVNAALAAVDMSRISHSVSHSVSHNVSHSVSHNVSHSVSHSVSHAVHFRIGIHCGPVTAGVIGTQRMQYDVWGDTVNVASRMESTGEPGRIHISQAFADILTAELVTRHSSLVTFLRGSIDVKGKGMMRTYWLESTSA